MTNKNQYLKYTDLQPSQNYIKYLRFTRIIHNLVGYARRRIQEEKVSPSDSHYLNDALIQLRTMEKKISRTDKQILKDYVDLIEEYNYIIKLNADYMFCFKNKQKYSFNDSELVRFSTELYNIGKKSQILECRNPAF